VNIVLWVVQIVLAVAFLSAGLMKLSQPKEKLSPRMHWVDDFQDRQVRTIGALEVLAAIGLILPAATRILPWLTPLAAIGLVLVMIGAAVTHLRRHEASSVGVNLILLALAAFVVIGRLTFASF
jgi:uncharacterized membrane protein YphA (DoxX/SURF4 family)